MSTQKLNKEQKTWPIKGLLSTFNHGLIVYVNACYNEGVTYVLMSYILNIVVWSYSDQFSKQKIKNDLYYINIKPQT